METSLLLIIVIGSLLLLLSMGVPIAFSLGSLATLFILFSWGSTGLFTLFQTAYDKSGDFILLAIPMFILMANVLGTSG
ncbi:MAG: TRAP transporter large permease subunit, partial [Deltaproteobacteria bacterium]|nr:TRAP transporter large permease subunit [Deltaproteobacteria bacterium]